MKIKRETKMKYSSVSIPYPLAEKLRKTIKNTGYVSVSDFVTDILRTILVIKDTNKKGDKAKTKKQSINQEENKILKQRLKSLGYM